MGFVEGVYPHCRKYPLLPENKVSGIFDWYPSYERKTSKSRLPSPVKNEARITG